MANLVLILCSTSFGVVFYFLKAALGLATPAAFLAARFGIAVLLLGVLIALRRERFARGKDGVLRPGLLLGAAMLAGQVLQTEGLRYTTPTRSAFLTSLQVLLVPFLARFVVGHPVRRASWLAVAISMTGLFFITRPLGGSAAGSAYLGDGLTVLCASCFALRTVWASRFAPIHPVTQLTFLQLAVTFAGALALVPLSPQRFPFTPDLLATVLVAGVLLSAVACLAQNWAQRHVSAVRAGLIGAVEPVSAALFAHFYGGDPLTPWDWAGGSLVLCGLVVGQLGGIAGSAGSPRDSVRLLLPWARLRASHAPTARPTRRGDREAEGA